VVTLKKKIAGLNAASLQRFVVRARKVARLKGTVDILITTSGNMRLLNDRFRGKDKPTDVLSFPAESSSSAVRRTPFAGEIAISADIALDNARRLGHPAATEVKVLVLHGILHLAGFDHERDNGKMAGKEASLRRALRLPSSLTERGNTGTETSAGIRHPAARPKTPQRTA
jgi:probable rRNA maturation factor